MRSVSIIFSGLLLGSCSGLMGESPDVDYNNIIVPIVSDCSGGRRDAIAVMEVGFAKVRAACEAFFVDATRYQQNALAMNNTIDVAQTAAAAIIPITNSASAAVKALAITTAGVAFGKSMVNQLANTYSFGTNLQKVRKLTVDSMDQFATYYRGAGNTPANACRAYSLVQEMALKCTLASLKDIEHQQMNLPSMPVLTTAIVETVNIGADAKGNQTRSISQRKVD